MTQGVEKKIPVLVIFAPTACGKTALCVNLFGNKSSFSVLKGKGEVISADSMSVYKKLDIGTAKPNAEEKNEIPHHLIDLFDVEEQFGAGEFVEYADKVCSEIYFRGKLPIIAGGTGFYIRNFLLGLPPTPVSNPLIREQLKTRIEKEGNAALYAELKLVDPVSAAKIHENDSYRICRALEIFYITGKARSECAMPVKLRDSYNFYTIILSRPREELYERIEKRVDIMFENGLADEVYSILSSGVSPLAPGMQAIGYQEFAKKWHGEQFSNNELEVIKEEIKHNSKKYAKKQYVFMRDIPNAEVFDISDDIDVNGKNMEIIVKKIISFYSSAMLST